MVSLCLLWSSDACMLTWVLGPAIHWRMPPRGNRGKVGISCCGAMVVMFGNDVVLPGKMSVESYLVEDSCMLCERREEEEEVLTKARREGGGRSHRLLTVLDHGAYHRVVAGAVDAETVSAHRC